MSAITYEIQIDLDKDYAFEGGSEDITSDVKSIQWSRGASDPQRKVAPAGKLNMTLRNVTKKYSPESGSALSGFKIGAPIRVRTTCNRGDRDGAYVNTPTFSVAGIGDGNTAVQFGASEYVNLKTTPLSSDVSSTAITLSVWFYIIAGTTSAEIADLDGPSGQQVIIRVTAANQVNFEASSGGGTYTYDATGVTESAWHHAAIVVDATYNLARSYLDGAILNEGTFDGALPPSIDAFEVGANGLRAAHVGLWITQLRPEQIAALYTNNARQFEAVITTEKSTLIGYWPLNETSGTVANDYIGTDQHFLGEIQSIKPTVNAKGIRETEVEAVGWFHRLLDDEIYASWQNNKRSDELILALITAATVPPPGYNPASDPDTWVVLQEGDNTYPFWGDNWRGGQRAYTALEQTVNAEQGFAFEGADGRLRFHNRSYPSTEGVKAVVRDIAESELKEGAVQRYEYGENLINECTILVYPRTVGTTTETVGYLRSSPRIEAGQSVTIVIKYADEAANVVGMGAYDVLFTKNTDWKANSESDGSGTDLSADFSSSISNRATQAEIVVTNSGGTAGYIVAVSPADYAVVRGKAIRAYETIIVVSRDQTSIDTYGYRPFKIDSKVMGDSEYARQLAAFLVGQDKDPRGVLRSITIRLSGSKLPYLSMEIGNALTISETQTGHASQRYYIIGLMHRVNNQFDHMLTLHLAPAPETGAWVLGVEGFSEIGETTLLGL